MNFSHLFLIIFILFGWLYPRLRLGHLIVVVLTGLSWFVFMQSKEIGYCILTDWHWQILRKLGETKLPETYFQYLYEQLTGVSIQENTARIICTSCFIISLLFSSVMVFRKYVYRSANIEVPHD